MAKGQVATVIIILVVIGAVVYFALPTLKNLPAFGGISGGTSPLQINNNIITIESYSVGSLKMFPNEQTVVSFLIQNNGDHEVDPTVNFYDFGGMSSPSLSCDFKPASNSQCSFKLRPFASGKVSLTLTAPDVGSLTTFKISYSIIYSYSGSRVAVIPIIDGLTRTTPLGRFAQSSAAYNPDSTKTPSYGPFELSYSFPSSGSSIQNGQTITQNWGVNKQPFRLELDLKYIGTIQGTRPPKLTNMVLTPSNNLELKHDQANDFCPYENNPNMQNVKEVSDISFNTLVLNCEFTPTISSPETTAQVATTFDYKVTILHSETFTVQPPEQKR